MPPRKSFGPDPRRDRTPALTFAWGSRYWTPAASPQGGLTLSIQLPYSNLAWPRINSLHKNQLAKRSFSQAHILLYNRLYDRFSGRDPGFDPSLAQCDCQWHYTTNAAGCPGSRKFESQPRRQHVSMAGPRVDACRGSAR